MKDMTNYGLSRDERVEAADRLLSELGTPVRLWMQSQGLEAADAQQRYVWGALLSHLKAQGTLSAAKLWTEAQAELMRTRFGVSNRKRVCLEICRRFCRAKMDKSGPPQRIAISLGDTAEMDALPDYLRWVVLHPGLFGKSDDPVIEAVVARYFKENPAPNQAAINLYLHCAGDKAARQKMFDEVKAVLLEERKKRKEQPVSEQDKAEGARILDMKAELAKLSKSATSATMSASS